MINISGIKFINFTQKEILVFDEKNKTKKKNYKKIIYKNIKINYEKKIIKI